MFSAVSVIVVPCVFFILSVPCFLCVLVLIPVLFVTSVRGGPMTHQSMVGPGSIAMSTQGIMMVPPGQTVMASQQGPIPGHPQMIQQQVAVCCSSLFCAVPIESFSLPPHLQAPLCLYFV